jgi:hypothetical protein
MEKEIVSQKIRFGLHANVCDRHHYYSAIPTNTAFEATTIPNSVEQLITSVISGPGGYPH